VQSTEQNAKTAAASPCIDAVFEKVTDSNRIMEMGVMMTPGLVVDACEKVTGKILNPEQIADIIKGNR
jgi:hypothetical protein